MAEAEAGADARARAGVEAIFERYHRIAAARSGQLYDFDAMNRAELLSVSAAERKVVYRFTPSERYANLNDVVHGGAYAVLFDMFTMTSLARPGYWDFMGGVTRSISISYLRGVRVNTPLYFHCRVVQHGRTMALLAGDVRTEDGAVCATCEHHKVHVPTKGEHMKFHVPWDDRWDGKGERDGKGAEEAGREMRIGKGPRTEGVGDEKTSGGDAKL